MRMQLLGTHVSPERQHLMKSGVVCAKVEDARHDCVSRSNSEVRVTRDEDNAVNWVLERRDPIRHVLPGRSRAGVPKVLRALELSVGEGPVTDVVGNTQL